MAGCSADMLVAALERNLRTWRLEQKTVKRPLASDLSTNKTKDGGPLTTFLRESWAGLPVALREPDPEPAIRIHAEPPALSVAPLLRQRRVKVHRSPTKASDNSLARNARAARDLLQTMADEETSTVMPLAMSSVDDCPAGDCAVPLILQFPDCENLVEFQSTCGNAGSAGTRCWTPPPNHAATATPELPDEQECAAFKLHLRKRRHQLMRQLLVSRRQRPSWRDPWPPPALAQPREQVRKCCHPGKFGSATERSVRPLENLPSFEVVETSTEQPVTAGVDADPTSREQESGAPVGSRRRPRSLSADSVSFLKRRRQESDGECDASGEDIEVCPSVHRRPRCLQGLPRPELLLLAGQLERRFF
uniref:Uncharacterized protein n=1 Tax=Noctiluca scintillans TaxID=2966 RepID=A0A7S0ZYM4_NOCSC|mmetsp:Transcript_2405/g.6963  ORF Transcript_2405/g.6963 Transcript_2405/m.6963 type:complete len:363 (+) Transcript_2405:1058-2146(+)